MKKIALLLLLAITIISCGSDDDAVLDPILGCTDETSLNYNSNATEDDNSCEYPHLTFKFTQNWDGDNITAQGFGNFDYTNENGEVLSLLKLRYLISKIILHKENGESITFEGYNLVNLSDINTLLFNIDEEVPLGTYSSLTFVYGFDQHDNISNEYLDLNSASWNWPTMLGGGYHFMQMEGNWVDSNGDSQPYAYHNGTARVSDGVFEQNFISVELPGFTITNNAEVEIKMNIAEWYKNPNTWKLSEMSTSLMGNYDAQIMMNQNGQNVFSIGEIAQ
ncbi:MAG: hypothetical protein QM499_02810 [Flavobacteriaceae bacterium]